MATATNSAAVPGCETNWPATGIMHTANSRRGKSLSRPVGKASSATARTT
jgi:hypothetical protein